MSASRNSLFAKKIILITGAGSGIGRATALKMAEYDTQLILCDLNAESVQETAVLARELGSAATTHTVNVSDWDDMQALSEKVHKHFGALDILVNNAGVGLGGDFLSTPIADWQWVIGINLMGVVHGCKLFAPAMVEKGGGHIVNVASAAGYYAAPEMTAYAASKHAVMGLSESLRAEMSEYGIGVSAICPGIINTNIVATGRMHGATGAAQEKIAALYRRRNYGPELVANAIVGAIENNRAVTPVSPEAWLMYGAKRFTPGLLGWASGSPLLKRLRP
ncbi:MAG: SDR family NAD(P)-dependent oxidoreductase [Moraxellaceae bacterium]|nr:SDR family NAD(P)-dependent oxidoreductase [Moraxellaceae bacterium]